MGRRDGRGARPKPGSFAADATAAGGNRLKPCRHVINKLLVEFIADRRPATSQQTKLNQTILNCGRHHVGDLLLDLGCAGSAGRVRHGAEARHCESAAEGAGPLRARGSGLPSSMTASGVGALASIALRSPSTPRRFSRSRGGGAHFGLTPRHSSDELIYQGRISKRRDPEAPALLLAG